MELADLSSQMTIDELWAVYDAHGEPFQSLAQCQLFLRAATMLRRRLPAESESSGERIALRDIESSMQEGRKWLGVYQVASEKPVSIIPPDNLR